MGRRKLLKATCSSFALLLLTACTRPSPEQALRDTIAEMVKAVEARDVKTLLEHIADDFTRNSGGLDRRQLRAMLVGVFLRHQKIHVVTTIRDVTIDGGRAQARFNVLATGASGSASLLPETGRLWTVDSAWRRVGADWKLYNADWRD